jgi:GAF domain-containing protein
VAIASTAAGYPAAFAAVIRSLTATGGVRPTIDQIVRWSIDIVPCQWAAAAVAERLGDRPPELAAMTDPELMGTVAQIAGRCGPSPGRSAFVEGSMVCCQDLSTATDWPAYATAMVQQTPVRALLSFGLRSHDRPLGVLTFYTGQVGAFDESARGRGRLLADVATLAIDAAASADRADNLQVGLETNRLIGTSVGILVERHRIDADTAFDMLRSVSSRTNRKLADVAAELVRTGNLPKP